MGVDLDGTGIGQELRGAEVGETIFILYLMRKESMFNKT